VAKALSPAKVKEVRINEDTGTAEVIVPDFQLSLAIGKEGQNARLAHRLTGWRIDIKSETQLAEEAAYQGEEWAQGEWIVDPESGEQMWQPADGSPAISAEEWNAASQEVAEDEVEASEDAPAADVDGADDDAADGSDDGSDGSDGSDDDAADGSAGGSDGADDAADDAAAVVEAPDASDATTDDEDGAPDGDDEEE
jgi:N utilization substance protein A